MRFNLTDMLYKENGKKNTYRWMRKDLLISSTDAFQQHYLRYEISKISSRKCFCHIQGENYEF